MERYEAEEHAVELLEKRFGRDDRDDYPAHEDCECEECLIRAQEEDDD